MPYLDFQNTYELEQLPTQTNLQRQEKRKKIIATFSRDLSLIVSFAITEQTVKPTARFGGVGEKFTQQCSWGGKGRTLWHPSSNGNKLF